jgi:hypothetical protein
MFEVKRFPPNSMPITTIVTTAPTIHIQAIFLLCRFVVDIANPPDVYREDAKVAKGFKIKVKNLCVLRVLAVRTELPPF